MACATCHAPEKGFTDGAPFSTGVRGQKGGRSAPTVINRAYSLAQFWDGRAPTLEDQGEGPIANPIEMDNTHDGKKSAMTPAQVRGMDVYFNKAKCDQCHEGVNFTANTYANLGIGTDKPEPDTGRFAVTKDPLDWGKLKTPTLRDISKTAPYMHDGSLKTPEEVVDFYDQDGTPNKNLDEKIKKLNLTDVQKSDLVAFLKALDGAPISLAIPASFPQ